MGNNAAVKRQDANKKTLDQVDSDHLWHPFTQTTVWSNDPLTIVARGKGSYLYDVNGKEYLDGVSSLWCNVHGHSDRRIVDALKNQVENLCHSTLLGLSHEPILELTDRLFKVLPSHLNRAFYADSGSNAVEAALRIAIEWWQKQESPEAKKRTKFASLVDAYHGDTMGAIGVGYSEPFHQSLKSMVSEAIRISPPHIFPNEEGKVDETSLTKSISEATRIFTEHGAEIAALIVEPLVQGASGILIHPAKYLEALDRLCKEHRVLLICDEVATGFGKTGTMFASEQADIRPDIMVLAKGLSAGYLPISAAITTEELFEGFRGKNSERKTFFFGQTFAGNPLAARAACVNLDIFSQDNFFEELNDRLGYFQELLKTKIEPLENVFEVRNLGVMTGVELTKTQGVHEIYPTDDLASHRVTLEARKRNAIIRPLGNTMVLMPPLSMKKSELDDLVEITAQSIQTALGSK